MRVIKQHVCEYAQLDRRSAASQLRGRGDGLHEIYDLFLRLEEQASGLVEVDGQPVDIYETFLQEATLGPAIMHMLVKLGRLLNKLELAHDKLDKLAEKYNIDLPAGNGFRGREGG